MRSTSLIYSYATTSGVDNGVLFVIDDSVIRVISRVKGWRGKAGGEHESACWKRDPGGSAQDKRGSDIRLQGEGSEESEEEIPKGASLRAIEAGLSRSVINPAVVASVNEVHLHANVQPSIPIVSSTLGENSISLLFQFST